VEPTAAPGSSIVYCIDANSLIQFAKRFPALDLLGVWDRLEELARGGRLIAPDVVKVEAVRLSRTILEPWTNRVPEMFISVDDAELLEIATSITRRWRHLVESGDPNEDADPWVIALAIKRTREAGFFGAPCVVVTEERPQKPPTVSRIPEICDILDIRWMDHFGLMREEGWRV